ncbi:ESAG8 [Symbiodinium sp. CCMP2592]|nr:ESAG8 [Symbiodinium sp. CCMP2592]
MATDCDGGGGSWRTGAAVTANTTTLTAPAWHKENDPVDAVDVQGRQHDVRPQSTCSLVVQFCKTRGTTNLRNSFDDTVFERERGGLCPAQEARTGTVVRCYLVARCDTNSQAWDVGLNARRLTSVTASLNLQQAGEVWAATTQGNDGLPPLCQCHDNHRTQTIFIGLTRFLRFSLYLRHSPQFEGRLRAQAFMFDVKRCTCLTKVQSSSLNSAKAAYNKFVKGLPGKEDRLFYGDLVFGVNFGTDTRGRPIQKKKPMLNGLDSEE